MHTKFQAARFHGFGVLEETHTLPFISIDLQYVHLLEHISYEKDRTMATYDQHHILLFIVRQGRSQKHGEAIRSLCPFTDVSP